MNTYPKISVVTPSYNQSQFIETTIKSVLNQDYPNIEYIIIDGGSTDGSVDIIERYADQLAYWISEKDKGQSHAINKGFLRATGEIICWLNSDDYFLPGTLRFVAEQLHKDNGSYALVGDSSVEYADGRPSHALKGRYTTHRALLEFWRDYSMHQPAIFWRREVYEAIGLLDEDLHYIMDFDYWTRISKKFGFTQIDRILACATWHAEAKTGDNFMTYYGDLQKYAKRYWGSPLKLEYWHLSLGMWRHYRLIPFGRRIKAKLRQLNLIASNSKPTSPI